MEKASAIHIVAVVVVNIAESTSMATSKSNHPTFEHFNKVARFVALCDTNLHRLSKNFII